MGIIEDFKKIDDWQTVTVIVVFLLICFGTITIGAFLSLNVLYVGGLVALGIPTSILGNIGIKTLKTNSSKKTEPIENKRLDHIEHNVATLACEFANLKSQFEIVKINKEIDSIE